MTTDHEWADSVGAYLLRALPTPEEAAFEAHLETCVVCRDEVEHLRVAADALPNSPLQLAPPEGLRDRVMAVVNAEAELLSAAGSRADEPPGRRAPRRRRVAAVLRPGWTSLRPALALVATMLVVALVGGGALIARSDRAGGESTHRVAFGPAKLIQRESGHSTLLAEHLRPPGAGRVYQVWLQRKGENAKPTNALFSARRDGTASVDVPGSLKGVKTVLVTNEPEGGSQQPTTDPVIVAHPD